MRKLLLLFFSVVAFSGAHAQYKPGVRSFARFDYPRAIVKLKKVRPSSQNRPDALAKIAESYWMLRDFKNAAQYYKMAFEAGVGDDLLHYHYGLCLKSLNRYEEALNEFTLYLKNNPSDSKAKNAVRSCKDMKAALSLAPEYKVTNLTSINTRHSELCPVLFDEGLVFVSYQKNNWVSVDQFADDGPPLLALYYADKKNDSAFTKKRIFSKKLNTDIHDGPICFSTDKNTLFFTRVEYLKGKKSRSQVSQPKLFYATRKGNSWQKPVPFWARARNRLPPGWARGR